jgi:hypothetical protein
MSYGHRAALPQRRMSFMTEVEHEGHKHHVTIGCYEDFNAGELFINPIGNAGKGSAIEALARDAAILISLGLQYGVPIETMRGAITRDDKEQPMTLIGAVLDAIERKQN